jgi:TonB family protein
MVTPPKPLWKPLSADDITVSKDVVKNSQPAPPAVSAADIEARLRNQRMRVSQSGPTGPISQVPASYYDTVASFLYQRWAQPSRAELSGRKPTVAVNISIDAAGRVKSVSIARRSGLAPMDSSVEALIAGLTSLPAPPNGAMTLSINMEIVDP